MILSKSYSRENNTFGKIRPGHYLENWINLNTLINSYSFDSLGSFLRSIAFSNQNETIQTKRYLEIYSVSEIVRKIFLLIQKYIDLLGVSEKQTESYHFSIFSSRFRKLANDLILFAVTRNKMMKFSIEASKPNNMQPFDFSIFDPEDDINNQPSIETTDPFIEIPITSTTTSDNPTGESSEETHSSESKGSDFEGKLLINLLDDPDNNGSKRPPPQGNSNNGSDPKNRWNTKNIVIVVSLTALGLGIGTGLVYYLTRESKNTPEI